MRSNTGAALCLYQWMDRQYGKGNTILWGLGIFLPWACPGDPVRHDSDKTNWFFMHVYMDRFTIFIAKGEN